MVAQLGPDKAKEEEYGGECSVCGTDVDVHDLEECPLCGTEKVCSDCRVEENCCFEDDLDDFEDEDDDL
jgi:hypothetical protein